MSSGVPAPEWIDASWWEVIGAPYRAERMSRAYWVEELARKWQLVRRPDALNAGELRAQEQRVKFLLSGGWLPTDEWLPGPPPGWLFQRLGGMGATVWTDDARAITEKGPL